MKNTLKISQIPLKYAILIGSLIVIAGISGALSIYGSHFSDAFINITGTYGKSHVLGIFDMTGGGGNAGKSIFPNDALEPLLAGDTTYVDTTVSPQKMVGNFFLESIGWATMENVELIAPLDMNVMTPWTLSGYAWTDNAGYIDFVSDGTYSGVTYTPGTKIFSGSAWSDTLGYLPFNIVDVDTGFKNKVKVLGNIGSSKAFNIEYDIGVTFDFAHTTEAINEFRKNIALITRGLPASKMNVSSLTNNVFQDLMYFKGSGIQVTNPGSKLNDNNLRSVIVEGGNIYITDNVIKDADIKKSRALIAIKDASEQGGNIYIEGDVRNIYASLVAEGTIYSGDQSEIYNDTTEKLTKLPKDQLYIHGAVISRNTIGGSAKSPNPVCPFTEINCTYTNSYKYDWNYFRTYDPDNAGSLSSEKAGYAEYSVIIEGDPDIIIDPPPGMMQKN